MLRIAVQAKGRLYEETMSFLAESDIKLSATKRTLLVQSSNFPIEVLFLRDDDIPQTVAAGIADIGIVGETSMPKRTKMPKSYADWASAVAVCRWPCPRISSIPVCNGSKAKPLPLPIPASFRAS